MPSHKQLKIWLVLGLLVALGGIGTTMYSVNHDIQLKVNNQTESACEINDEFSCNTVAEDELAVILGVPLGFYGTAYFVAVIILLLIGLSDLSVSRAHIHAYCAMNIIGFVVAISLFLYAKYGIKVLCPSCMAIDTVTILQLILMGLFYRSVPKGLSIKNLIFGGATATSVVILVVAGYMLFGPRLS